MGIAAFDVTKVLLFKVLPLPRWGLPPSTLPKYRYLQCCSLAQVWIVALEVTKVLEIAAIEVTKV